MSSNEDENYLHNDAVYEKEAIRRSLKEDLIFIQNTLASLQERITEREKRLFNNGRVNELWEKVFIL